MKILVIGCLGMLGSDLTELLRKQGRGLDLKGVDLPEVDITEFQAVEKVFRGFDPEVVINCSAYTNVDMAETEKEKAFSVNADGPMNLAKACANAGPVLVHISTDYIFDGKKQKPYTEEDQTNPIGIYGKSKLEGEMRISESMAADKYLIVRTQWLFGKNGQNFVATILKLAGERRELTVVDDQLGKPTWTKDLAKGIMALIEGGRRGIYNVTNSGSCSWFEYAKEIIRLKGLDNVRVREMKSIELKRPAPRPMYSILSTEKFEKDTGIKLQHWKDALKEYLSGK